MNGRHRVRLADAGAKPLLSSFFILFFLGIALLLPQPSLSQPVFRYDAFHAEFLVQPDGTLILTDRVTYLFTETSGWVGIYVPSTLGYVSDAQVLSGGGETLPPDSWEMKRDEEGCSLWFRSAGSPKTFTVIYRFAITGALLPSGDRVHLKWNPVPEGRSSPIGQCSVIVDLPSPVPPESFDFRIHTRNYRGQIQKRLVGDRRAVAELEGLPADASLDIEASWPAEIMDLNGPGFARPAEGPPQENGKSWEFERFDVDVTLNTDSSLTVRETQVVRFKGAFTFLNRDLSTAKASFSEGRTYGRVRVRDIRVYDLHGQPYDGALWRVENKNGSKRVHLEFTAADETRGWIIEYRITGALIFAADYDRLYWDAVPEDRGVYIRSSKVTVNLPAETNMELVKMSSYADSFAPPREYQEGTDDRTLWWTAKDIPPYTTFTIDVSLPKGLIRIPALYGWTAGKISLGSASALIALTLFLMVFTWWRKGRDVVSRRDRLVRYRPPQGLTPALVGYLVRQKAHAQDITVTIVDLACRGYLKIFEDDSRDFIRKKVYGFEKTSKDPSGLLAYEKRILDALFENGHRVTEEDLKYVFYEHVPSILKEIGDEALKRRLFDRDPARVRRCYVYLSAAMVVTSLALFFILPTWFDLGWLQAPILALIPAGSIVGGLGWFMPRRSREGSRAYGQVLGFKDYLCTAEGPELDHMTPEYFEKSLPYALVLGMAERWFGWFEQLYSSPPSWFVTDASPFTMAGLGASLQSLNRSLIPVLTSAPSSSSSKFTGSGGGFGGGFSGGGFGGGGSSAG